MFCMNTCALSRKTDFFFFLLLRTNLSLEADLALMHRLEEKPSSLTTRPWPFHGVQHFPVLTASCLSLESSKLAAAGPGC